VLDEDDAFSFADDLRRIGQDIIAEREALLAIVLEHAGPKLLAALNAHLAKPLRFGAEDDAGCWCEQLLQTLH